MGKNKPNNQKNLKQNKTFNEKIKSDLNTFKPLLIKNIDNILIEKQQKYIEKIKNKKNSKYDYFYNMLVKINDNQLNYFCDILKKSNNKIISDWINKNLTINNTKFNVLLTEVDDKKLLFRSLNKKNKEVKLNKYENKINIYRQFQFSKKDVKKSNLETLKIINEHKLKVKEFKILKINMLKEEENRLKIKNQEKLEEKKQLVRIFKEKRNQKEKDILEKRQKFNEENLILLENFKKKYLGRNLIYKKLEKNYYTNETQFKDKILKSIKLEHNKYKVKDAFKNHFSSMKKLKTIIFKPQINKEIWEKRIKLEKIKKFDKKIREINLNKNDDIENEEDENNDAHASIKINNEYTKKLKENNERIEKLKEKIEENLKEKHKYMTEGNKLARERLETLNKNTLSTKKNKSKKNSISQELKKSKKYLIQPNFKLKKKNIDINMLKKLSHREIYTKLTNLESKTLQKEMELKFIKKDEIVDYKTKIDNDYLDLINLKLQVLNCN